MTAWKPEVDPEPVGWHRETRTARRRPNGDPAQEYIEP